MISGEDDFTLVVFVLDWNKQTSLNATKNRRIRRVRKRICIQEHYNVGCLD